MRLSSDIFDRAHSYVEHCRRHYSRQPWRASLSFAWWGMLHSFCRTRTDSGLHGEELRVALVLDGGMGDVLFHIRYIKDLCAQCGPFSLDVYTPLSPCIIQKLLDGAVHVRAVRKGKVKEAYDLIIYSLLMPMTVFFDARRVEKLASPALKAYVAALESFKADNPQWFKQQEYFMADILNYARILEKKRAEFPYMLGSIRPQAEECVDMSLSAMDFPWGERPFITVSRGAGGDADSTKLWPEEKYDTLMCLIRERFPKAVFVQTGKAGEAKLEADCDMRGKTTLDELTALMARADLHISSEGGTVHLRHLLRGGPSVVLFGPTDPAFYGYPENCDLRAAECLPCEWAQREWQKQCVRGFDQCRAMEALQPDFVFKEMLEHPQIREALCRML